MSCEKQTTNPPPSPEPEIDLSLSEEPHLTEISLKLETRNLALPQQFLITRNDSAIFNDLMAANDTTVTDTGLFPAATYSYRAYRLANGQRADSSAVLQVSTMDTTSHNFQWEAYTIESPFGSALLQDVAIINENDIWAVGAIAADSAQPWLPYNAVHWDGQEWELKRIPTNSVVGIGYYPINTVFAFNSDNIWMFSDAGSYCHWNGNNWQTQYVPERQGGIKKIWGSSPTDIYFVGTNGNITHYNGSDWQKLESGTDLPIQDIWGVENTPGGEKQIYCIASTKFQGGESKVMKIENNTVINISTDSLSWSISSVWSSNGREWYICGDGLYKNRNPYSPWEKISGPPLIYMERIRGTEINDIFVVGHFGLVSHWNGLSWHTYPAMQRKYYGLAIKGDLVVAVGQETAGIVGGDAAILMGRRN